ncbi:MAG: hypothetical protein KKC64_03470 [Spirochaetes bacterium]|nr:hypothetical protein [Spirochaetota bacterium]
MKGPGFLSRIAFLYRFFLIFTLGLCCSTCTKPDPSFSAVLALIDQQTADADPRLFTTAFFLANTTEDKLRVLKRAQAFDSSLVFMLAAENYHTVQSEPVALVFFDAFMNSRDWSRAFSVWHNALSYPEYSGLLVELALELGWENPLGLLEFDATQLCLAAADAKLPELLTLRALLALYEADTSLAAVLLAEAATSTLLLPAQVLWDAGLDTQLLDRQNQYLDWPSRNLLINAAYELYQPELALSLVELYLEQVDADDQAILFRLTAAYFSYLLAADAGFYDIPVAVSERHWPFEREESKFTEHIRNLHQMAEELYSSLYTTYPDIPEIRLQYVLWLLASRQFDKFSMFVSEFDNSAAESALLLLLYKYYKDGPDYVRVQAAREAARFRDSDTLSAIQRFFLSIDAYDDFTSIQSRYELDSNENSLFAAYQAVYEGSYQKAQQLFSELFLPGQPMLAPYNLGILSLKAGNYTSAADYFRTAALTAKPQAGSKRVADAWIWAARSVFMLGNNAESARFLQNALYADPDSGQARLFLLQLNNE